jgi:hypothetical protein
MHVCFCNVQVVELHFACEWLGVFLCVYMCTYRYPPYLSSVLFIPKFSVCHVMLPSG